MPRDEFLSILPYKEKAHKKEVLDFMRSEGHAVGITTQPVYDKVTGEKVFGADNCHHDENYYWYETDIYCLEKYNIMPSDEFVQYVLDKAGDGK